MVKRVALLVILFIFSISSSVLGAEPGDGVIDGTIGNGTAGGSSVANLEITLKTYQDDTEADSATTDTDGDGYFIFNGLSTEPGYSYEVTLNYQQADYTSDRISFEEGETSKFISVTVYDSTTSVEDISVPMSYKIIYAGEATLLIKEYYLYANDADRTYIGPDATGDGATLIFSLPEGAVGLQPTLGLMDCCTVGTADGFTDTMPLLPGMKEVAFSYEVPYDSGKYTLSQTVNYPITSFDLLIQGEIIEATGDQLVPGEPIEISGTIFSHLSRQDLLPGDELNIRLAGLPASKSQGAIIWTIVVLVVLAAGFSLIYRLRKNKLQPVRIDDTPEQVKNRLLAGLAKLDDDFAAGTIPEKDYQRLRAEKKAQLVKLIRGSKEESGDG